jgi:diaminopimelate epimerase
MKKTTFYKLQASGNDFILLDNRKLKIGNSKLKGIAKKFCQRKLGIGADGLLVIEPAKKAKFKMRIFNPDGSEPQMCGNGARSVAGWTRLKTLSFETKAGIIEAKTGKNQVKIKLSDPKGLKLNIPIKVLGRKIKVNFINTGVPHAVILVQGLEEIDVEAIGQAVRWHKRFSPRGVNVDFVEVLKGDLIKIRTYERGVEAETLACGTGAVASAIIATSKNRKKVLTKSGEILKVCFEKNRGKINNVWLEGKADLVYKGEIYA